jgi:hypothetical protein
MRVNVNQIRVVGLSGLLLLTFAVMGCSGSAKTAGTGIVADSAAANNSAANSSAATGAGTGTGSASVSWLAPTVNTDGSAITPLIGYRIYYGASADALTETIEVTGETVTTYVVDGLSSGTYYFAVTALAADGQESTLSDTASKTI